MDTEAQSQSSLELQLLMELMKVHGLAKPFS
jgi:hypothetical protein